jgi:magnesium chelatase subunit H
MPKRTSAADGASPAATPIRVVLVTLDAHLASAAARAERRLREHLPGLSLAVHAASEWGEDGAALDRCRADVAQGDIVIATMLFMEDHFRPLLPALAARREACDAMVCAMSAGEVMRLTRMGRFAMDGSTSGPMAWLKKLRGKPATGADRKPNTPPTGSGEAQMKMLRRLPQFLRFIPGTAQDVRAYFLVLQYWLAGSEDNIANLVRLLVERYAAGPREALRALARPDAPQAYPEVGVYHPALRSPAGLRMSEHLAALPGAGKPGPAGTVGLLLMRSYLLAGNAAHYDGVIAALEARGLTAIPAFASGLDSRPAIERFFFDAKGRPTVDAVLSLTGFSLVGGPAYNDAHAAEEMLARLDVPYHAAMAVEFQTLEQWRRNDRGLMPVESTMMVAIPELDGATGAMVFGGRGGDPSAAISTAQQAAHDMVVDAERAAMLAARVAAQVALRRRAHAERRVAVVLFNFPPAAGNTGTAAFLAVFESLLETLRAMRDRGYTVEVPESADALRERLLHGNADRLGTPANVHARIATDDHVRREPHLKEIEAQWGPAPGRIQTDGRAIQVLGERFGNVFVGVQPGFGYEGDPMRLLFERGFAPTHAFSAFYRWLREDFRADALLHFGTHGALEFMPGKQSGLASDCWPDRLIGALPHFYLYACNNPSEGCIAKRRAGATLVSYLTPPLTQSGLYRGLLDLKSSLERWRGLGPGDETERSSLGLLVQAQAAVLELCAAEPAWGRSADAEVPALHRRVQELEQTLIPHGLHVVGQAPNAEAQLDMLRGLAEASHGHAPPLQALQALVEGVAPELIVQRGLAPAAEMSLLNEMAVQRELLIGRHELDGLLHALDGGYLRPAPGGDLLRTPAVLPTGRNLHGFDPFRLPSAYAVQDGARQAQRLLARHASDGHGLPESVALVLWGTDNLKSEGAPIAQALALMGAAPRFDSYGRLAGAELIPLERLGRPRIDVMVTLSGIFRDLLPLQVKLLAEAALLAAGAETESTDQNFVRKHALAFMAEHGGDLETAALRVFGNAEGAYGANVNHLVDSSRWQGEDELAETYTRRKGFAYGVSGRPVQQPALLASVLAGVDLAYQNLESAELGVTTVDTYFDTLGGISRAVKRAKVRAGQSDAAEAPVYIGDQTQGDIGTGVVRTLSEQVALETRTRMLNPKFFEALLAHGYEGVRHLEAHVTNTFAWSATTGQVQPWVYQQISETFVLDAAMRERLAALNPAASAKLANRLLEAQRREFWHPDPETLKALEAAGDELEDRLEGVFVPAAPVISTTTKTKAAA